jgi:hypothetical protein
MGTEGKQDERHIQWRLVATRRWSVWLRDGSGVKANMVAVAEWCKCGGGKAERGTHQKNVRSKASTRDGGSSHWRADTSQGYH